MDTNIKIVVVVVLICTTWLLTMAISQLSRSMLNRTQVRCMDAAIEKDFDDVYVDLDRDDLDELIESLQ